MAQDDTAARLERQGKVEAGVMQGKMREEKRRGEGPKNMRVSKTGRAGMIRSREPWPTERATKTSSGGGHDDEASRL